jgi:hypothetical protein
MRKSQVKTSKTAALSDVSNVRAVSITEFFQADA